MNTFISGLIAGGTEGLIVITPMETLKVKLIHDKLSISPQYRNLMHGIYTIIQKEGFSGVYKGNFFI